MTGGREVRCAADAEKRWLLYTVAAVPFRARATLFPRRYGALHLAPRWGWTGGGGPAPDPLRGPRGTPVWRAAGDGYTAISASKALLSTYDWAAQRAAQSYLENKFSPRVRVMPYIGAAVGPVHKPEWSNGLCNLRTTLPGRPATHSPTAEEPTATSGSDAGLASSPRSPLAPLSHHCILGDVWNRRDSLLKTWRNCVTRVQEARFALSKMRKTYEG